MPRFDVTVERTERYSAVVTVKAKTPEDAMRIALNRKIDDSQFTYDCHGPHTALGATKVS